MYHADKPEGGSQEIPVTLPPSAPDRPGVQLPPPEIQTPHPSPANQPRASVPMTDGTPAPCRQKHAASFLAGQTPGVMASYGQGAREPDAPIPTLENETAIRSLVRWREEAPYG